MKVRKSIIMAVAASLTGLVAIALSGCEWFSFKKNTPNEVSDSLGYENDMAAWLTSSAASPRMDALAGYLEYQEAVRTGVIDSPELSFLDYLKLINDDSASLTSALRSSVAIVARANSGSGQASFGSGVIYSLYPEGDNTNAYLITNYHVVYNDSTHGICGDISTYFYGDDYLSDINNSPKAEYVGGSKEQDIAVLSMKIPSGKENFVQSISADVGKRDSDDASVGEKVYAIGNLLGNGISVVSGVVSVESEYVDSKLAMRIDAPVNHGNSGGGLFDKDGKLLGIVFGGKEVTVNTDDGNATIAVDGCGFAIPVNRAVSVAQSIIDNAGYDNPKAAYRGLLGTLEIKSSTGTFVPSLQKINIVEDVVVRELDSKSPSFSEDIIGKVIRSIVVTHNGTKTIEQPIVRKHQVETVLFNLRKGDHVVLVFDDGFAEADYTDASMFYTVK